MSRPTGRRIASTTALAVALTTMLAGPASAHVSVSPETASQGEFATLDLRVANEKDNASTTKLQVAFPADAPLASIRIKPVPGWTYQVTKGKLPQPVQTDDGPISEAISQVTWTADAGGGIKPGEFQEFGFSGGPMPTAPSMAFKALQTYSDGSVARWIEEQTPGGPEPESPAPTVTLTPAGANGTAGATAPAAPAAPSASEGAASKSSVAVATGLGIAGIALGALGGVLGGTALARRRQIGEAGTRTGADLVGSGRN